MDCPATETIAAYVAGSGSPELDRHVDGCEACRQTIATAIRAGRTAGVEHGDIAIGTAIDRYIVQRIRGTGAMGHVYEATDPELDRTIALKVVRAPDDAGDARALREGRALAKLAHPNVVAVHDVGTFAGGVWIAMELVHGETVRAWALTRPPVRRVVEVFAAAARGLAAAHAAGLVHRDVKPDNLVVGDDGRVRVIDFGLALVAGSDGLAAGTPAYMAPELAGQPADPRSDQYAFARSLREVTPVVPGWLAAILDRAHADDPARRYPGLAAVATALERGLGRRRRFAVAGALAVVAAGAASIGMVAAGGPQRSECELAAARAHVAWNAEARARIEQRFAGAAGPIGFADVATVLDTYASTWANAYQSACGADEPHPTTAGRQRLVCLDGHLRKLEVVLALDRPAELAAAVFGLPPPDCSDAVAAVLPADVGASTRAAVEEIRDRVAAASTLDDVGRGDDALAKLREAAAAAQRLAIPALEVEVRLALGRLEVGDGLAPAGEATLRAVAAQAHAIGDRAGEAEATGWLAGALIMRGKLAEAARVLDVADRLVEAAGNGVRLRQLLLSARIQHAGSQGDSVKVRALAEQQLALAVATYGQVDRRVVDATISLAAASVSADPATSRVHLAKARALANQLVGRTHPLLAELDRAQCLAERADPKVARRYCESAIAYFTNGGAAYRMPLAKTQLSLAAFGGDGAFELVTAARSAFEPGSVYRALADAELAAIERRRMNHVGAAAAATEAVAGLDAVLEHDSAPVIRELGFLGRDLMMTGRNAEATVVLARVAAGQEHLGTAVATRVDTLLQLAAAHYYQSKPAEARATVQRAIALAGSSDVAVAEAQFSSAALFLELEDLAAAEAAVGEAQRLAKSPSLRARIELARSEIAAMRARLGPARQAQRKGAALAATSGEPFVVFMAQLADCDLLVRERAFARAITACTKLVAISEAGFGHDHVALLSILTPLAEAQLAVRAPDAMASIDRAIAIALREHDVRRLAAARHVKATILDAAGDRTAARALEETTLATASPSTARQIRAWLAAHR
ncbi:MAG: serine/threonine-protein kinase [Kofleriaceae bacterium]